MRVYDDSTARKDRFTVQVNWSRPRAFSLRQRFWIQENIQNVPGVYMLYMREHRYSYTRNKESPVLYFGSGWILARLLHHLASEHEDRRNPIIDDHLANVPLCFRWAEVEDEDHQDWPVVTESILVHEFHRRYGALPPANRIRPPRRPAFDASFINQHPIDAIDGL